MPYQNGNQYQQHDKLGRPKAVSGLYANEFGGKGYVRMNGKLFKIEVSKSKKTKKNKKGESLTHWVAVTDLGSVNGNGNRGI